MHSYSVQELKKEMSTLKPAELINICSRLTRFKKENKELVTYLVFQAHDEEGYIKTVKQEIEELFGTINLSHLYFAKKTLRNIIRLINKYSRYSGQKQTDMELRMFFCRQLKDSGIPFHRNTVITNIYESQLKKVTSALASLHEDLQHDYSRELEELSVFKRL